MDVNKIVEIALQCGIEVRPPMRLVNKGDISKFEIPNEITPFGFRIIEFAELIAQEARK